MAQLRKERGGIDTFIGVDRGGNEPMEPMENSITKEIREMVVPLGGKKKKKLRTTYQANNMQYMGGFKPITEKEFDED